MKRGTSLAPLREHNFRWYYAAEGVNLAGSMMNGVALAFAVLEISDSPSALGVVLAAHSIPMIVFLLLGGVIADRFGRALVIQVGNVLSGVTQLAIAALVLTGTGQLWQLAVLAAINGVVSAMSFPAFASLVPQLVPREQLQPANALIALQRNALAVLGPAVAGILVVTIGAGWAVAFDGATYLLAALLLLPVKIPPPLPREDAPGVWADLREGWAYFVGTTWLWVIVAAFGVLNALSAGAFGTLGPVLAKETSIGESGWGLILSARAVGLLLMSLVLLRVPLKRPLFWGMIGMTLNCLPMLALGVDPVLAVAILGALLAGIGTEVFGIGWSLAMQEHVPDEMLSRAYSYDALGSFVAIPIGQLAFGPIGSAFGIQQSMLVAGFLYLAVCLLTLSSRSVRDLPRAATEVAAAPDPTVR